MFISVGRIWAGRPAAKLDVAERGSRTRADEAAAPDLPAAIGASDGDLVRLVSHKMDAAEAHRHQAMMMFLSNTGKRS